MSDENARTNRYTLTLSTRKDSRGWWIATLEGSSGSLQSVAFDPAGACCTVLARFLAHVGISNFDTFDTFIEAWDQANNIVANWGWPQDLGTYEDSTFRD